MPPASHKPLSDIRLSSGCTDLVFSCTFHNFKPVICNVRFTAHCALYCAEKQVVELVQGGAKVRVRNSTKHQYLDALAQYRLANSQRDEMEHFLKGLNELIPDNLLSIFDENELEVRQHKHLHKSNVVTCIPEVTNSLLLGFYSQYFVC